MLLWADWTALDLIWLLLPVAVAWLFWRPRMAGRSTAPARDQVQPPPASPRVLTARVSEQHVLVARPLPEQVDCSGQGRDLAEWLDRAAVLQAELDAAADRCARQLAALEQTLVSAQQAAARLEAALEASHPGHLAGSYSEQAQGLAHRVQQVEVDRAASAARPAAAARPSQRIQQLAADGYTSAEIAELVGTPLGEVELILGLRLGG